MGCWHETCRISNLPIVGDEEIVALKTNSRREMEMYFESFFFNGISFAKGKLNPYGNLEDISVKQIAHHLKNEIFNTEKGFITFCYADLFYKIVEEGKKIFSDLPIIIGSDISEVSKDMQYFANFMNLARSGFSENLYRGSQDIQLFFRNFILEISIAKSKEIEALCK